jgi:hypothetical protein
MVSGERAVESPISSYAKLIKIRPEFLPLIRSLANDGLWPRAAIDDKAEPQGPKLIAHKRTSARACRMRSRPAAGEQRYSIKHQG